MTTTTTEFDLTDDQRRLLPTDEDVRFYAEHGWYLSKKLLTDAQTDELHAASERFYAGERDRELPARPPRLAAWEPEHGAVQRHNDYVHYLHDVFGAILRNPLIGAVAARLAQAEEIRIFQSTLIYKPPVAGEPTNLVPWHFDKHYWATSTSDRMLTAFIPFHDCTVEMGTITMIDGSHRWREFGERDSTTLHFADRDRSELDEMLAVNAARNGARVRRVPMEIPKGHMSFHHCRTYHGSGANVSAAPRRAVSLHLQDGANAYRPVTLSDGNPVAYNHDAVVRRVDGRPDYADPRFCPTIWRS
ncbi:phytanoyl-CoA dioxygenase family protein [Nocardia huaxiensis]|uniref:Phytanoyl-CoA dioxygenase family protein n=1 Tax=Nocardia huaxiensis TaxID=2755382 RepID=A0A7D6V8S9_9NOCA|nr:phytanoyl-CoA dioxygenase family protein [Nocardia huaxiensis]QLY29574.1 phytanoyl-CoA dioxygenase family protein [Nocardia huaxiensis]UFS96859.1 phytanoyl-CoA dioxygenase family protein [Nocardia huaxiensis]